MPSRKEVLVEEHGRQHASTRAILSKENKGDGESSFRVYYGTTGAAVPFMWESQPGTPKHPIFRSSNDENDNSLPPLTPPPSYTATSSLTLGHPSRKCRKTSIFDIIFSFRLWKNSDVTPVSTLSTISSTSSSSSLSSPRLVRRKNDKSHWKGSSYSSFGDEDDNGDMVTPNSVMCFGFKNKYQRCYSMQDLKNAISALRGH